MYKVLLVAYIGITTISTQASIPFDNSIDRWTNDCSYGMLGACLIASNMYTKGQWEDSNTGKIVKISLTKKERLEKAKFYKMRACVLGSKKSCIEPKQ